MSEDTFGIPEKDFDEFYVQAEAAQMELEAMSRGEIMADPLAAGSAFARLSRAYGVPADPNDIGPKVPAMREDVRDFIN